MLGGPSEDVTRPATVEGVMVRTAGRAWTIALIVACQSTQSLAFGAIALFLPLIREDIGLTFSEAGTLAVASTLTYAVMQIPSGYLADRFDPRKLFVWGLLGTNAMSFLFSVITTYQGLLVNQAISGIFRSLVFAPGLVLISSHFAEDRRATAMGLYVAGGFSSNILVSLLGPFLVEPLGWRVLFLLSSSVAIATVLVYWRVGNTGPAISGKDKAASGNLRGLLNNPVIWLAAVIQFVRLALAKASQFWLPTYLVTDGGFSLRVAGLVVAIGGAVTAPANFLGGWLSDRLQRPLLIIGTSLAVLGTTSILLPNVESLYLVLLVIAVQSIFIQVYFGPLFEVPIRFIGPQAAGTISGFSNFWANVGGLTFTYTLGAVKDATGSFEIGFYSLSGLCALGLMCTALLSRFGSESDEVQLAKMSEQGEVRGL